MFEYDNTFIFMPFEAAQAFFKQTETATFLEIYFDTPQRAIDEIDVILGRAPPGIQVFDWKTVNSTFFSALQVERNVMFLILTLIILVAAFNIISSLIMLVNDKGRDIAILRTMGRNQRVGHARILHLRRQHRSRRHAERTCLGGRLCDQY